MDYCEICQTPFKRRYRRGGQRKRFCSRACAYQAKTEDRVEKTCRFCGRLFEVIAMHQNRVLCCSNECYERLRNSSELTTCRMCGKPVTGRSQGPSSTKEYCSRKCAGAMRRWQCNQKDYQALGYLFCLRRHSRLQCEQCSVSDYPEILQVHHKDGDRSNFAEANLTLLCPNCHSQQHRKTSGRGEQLREWAVAVHKAMENGTFNPP